MVQAVALRGSAARAWLISLSASSNRLVNKLAAARSTCASATSSNSRDLRENLVASGYAASKRRNFPISRSPRATIFSLAAAAAGKSPASFAEFAAANRRSNSSSGDAGFCCALACRHPRTASRKRHAPRADHLQTVNKVDASETSRVRESTQAVVVVDILAAVNSTHLRPSFTQASSIVFAFVRQASIIATGRRISSP